MLFNRNLRVHDHPALAAAVTAAEHVVPLFVFDDAVFASGYARPNRAAFLLACLEDLRGVLEARGGTPVVRRGDVVGETLRVAWRGGARADRLSRAAPRPRRGGCAVRQRRQGG